MKTVLSSIKRRLYLYVAAIFILALFLGYVIDFSHLNIKPISLAAVFIMLYPMLTGMAIERVKRAALNYKLILSTLFFAYFVASATAFFISRTILAPYPDLALAIVLVGAIPCSNMLIGWTGIADASVEDSLVIAVVGLLLIPFISPVIVKLSGGAIVHVPFSQLMGILLIYIFVPLVLGFVTRHIIIKRKGKKAFMEIKQYFPAISATGILVIVFFSVAKVSRIVMVHPIIFLLVFAGLFTYYIIQTVLSVMTARLLKLKYEQGMILILGATASSQAISLAIAATVFSSETVFALSFKPILQVLYIMFLIYSLGPHIKRFLGTANTENNGVPSTGM